jgi:hypothetical protein
LFCLDLDDDFNSTRCYKSDFYLVDTLIQNNWLYGFNVTDIGGILGLGYNTTGSNSFWGNAGVSPQRYSVSLYPTVVDWSWQANPESLADVPKSDLLFGKVDPFLYNVKRENDVIVVNSSYAGALAIQLASYNLKDSAPDSPAIYNLLSVNALNSTIDNLHMSTFDMGFNGFGVPKVVFMNMFKVLNETLGNFTCVNDVGYGSFCVSERSCSDLTPSLTHDYSLTFTFSSQPTYEFNVPLSNLLRTSPTNSSQCDLLIVDMGGTTEAGKNALFVFGNVFY